ACRRVCRGDVLPPPLAMRDRGADDLRRVEPSPVVITPIGGKPSTPQTCAARSQFGGGAPLNSPPIFSFYLTQFEIKHSSSALSMISRARSISPSPLTVI